MLIIDRFEGDWAVLETESHTIFIIPRNLLPEGASEGSVLRMNLVIDHEETARRKAKAARSLDGFFDE